MGCIPVGNKGYIYRKINYKKASLKIKKIWHLDKKRQKNIYIYDLLNIIE